MLFCTKAKHIPIELMMTSVPRFPPKGHGRYVLGKHKYTAKDCDCHFCSFYKINKCTLEKCECIEECIDAVSIGYVEFMKHVFEPIKNRDFHKRLTEHLKNERGIKTMSYKGNAHKEMFERDIERNLNSDNVMLSALYLLTADKFLWSKVKYAVGEKNINFSIVHLGEISTDNYALYMTQQEG